MKTKMKNSTMSVLFALLLGLAVGFMGTDTVSAYDGPNVCNIKVWSASEQMGGTATPETVESGGTSTITADYPKDGRAFSHWEPGFPENIEVEFGNDAAFSTTVRLSEFDSDVHEVCIIPCYTDILVDDILDQVYTGKAIKPNVKRVYIEDIDLYLEPEKDYKVIYENNINVGTATARIEVYDNEGFKKGHITKKFGITPADITQADVWINDKVYTGKPIAPDIKVTWHGQTLKAGRDYTMTYGNNVKVGTVNVKMKGINNFYGEINTSFDIKKKPASPAPKVSGTLMSKVTTKGKTGLTYKWSKIKGASGYDIFFAECNHGSKSTACRKVKSIKGNKTFSWTKTGLDKRTPYKAYIKAYVMKNGKKSYVRTSPILHTYTSGYTRNFTNAKSVTVNKTKVTLKKDKSFEIKAGVIKLKKNRQLMGKGHAPTIRYLTTNKKVATVSGSGKITARGKGTCSIIAFAHNGVSKTIKVTVK